MHSFLRTLNNGLCEMTCSIPIMKKLDAQTKQIEYKYTVYSSKISVGSQKDEEYEYVHVRSEENPGKIYNRCLIIDRGSVEKGKKF